ncbi:hypothetical protein CDAR_180161 [Caerostris darwini]|uniref:Uncharacterized protein n=1 Tax=Caerostris darwini TaxID=1538125 RepID=A0AAV4PER9_9ARAC|nr:hypothetical protein CDAR_180161 [Caerostris darwini]
MEKASLSTSPTSFPLTKLCASFPEEKGLPLRIKIPSCGYSFSNEQTPATSREFRASSSTSYGESFITNIPNQPPINETMCILSSLKKRVFLFGSRFLHAGIHSLTSKPPQPVENSGLQAARRMEKASLPTSPTSFPLTKLCASPEITTLSGIICCADIERISASLKKRVFLFGSSFLHAAIHSLTSKPSQPAENSGLQAARRMEKASLPTSPTSFLLTKLCASYVRRTHLLMFIPAISDFMKIPANMFRVLRILTDF